LKSSSFNVGYNENTTLNFNSNNIYLTEYSKWIDSNSGSDSSTKLLTTVHPVCKKLEDLVETNTDLIKYVKYGDTNSISIPIRIYFKVNALDNTGDDNTVDLNNYAKNNVHIKKIKFFLETEFDRQPFEFVVEFNISIYRNISYNTIASPYIQRLASQDFDYIDDIKFN